MVGGSRSTRREPMHTRGEHANSTQKGPRWGSNLEPSHCEATVLTTTPPCSPRLKSPPIIKFVLEISGIILKVFLKNFGSSQFGPYTFSNLIGMECISPVTTMYLPSLSAMVDLCRKAILFRIIMAAPLALAVILEWYTWLIQLALILLCASFFRCLLQKNHIRLHLSQMR